MKTVVHYGFAITLFTAVFFSLLVMNLISVFMLMKLSGKEETEEASDSYFFAGYELSRH